MKLTKRIKKSIIQSTLFGGIFFLILLSALGVFIYPQISEFEEKKDELVLIYNQYGDELINGISYEDFKKNIPSGGDENYTKILLENIDDAFFASNFTNTEEGSYEEYLSSVETKVSDRKSSNEYIEKDNFLNLFLPTYDKNNSSLDQTLTDFYFINYIENLLYSFNLDYEGNIGVGNIINTNEALGGATGQQNTLQEDIYAIPLSFTIVGAKGDVVDFLHYFENVSRISIVDDDFQVYEDDFIQKQIEGAITGSKYNIYENQLSDIVSLSLKEYPDDSARSSDSLVTAMKTLQAKERYEIDVELQFYVAGVPGYKMQNYITNFFNNYTEASANIKRDTQRYVAQKYKYSSSKELTAIQSLQSLELLMLSFETDVLTLKKDNLDPNNIIETYNQSTIYYDQLEKIIATYNTQLDTLTVQ